jgi:hypothetical protein
MKSFDVGDLVRDVLNNGDGSYGLGVVVTVDSENRCEQYIPSTNEEIPPEINEIMAPRPPGKRYDIYFNKFERIITFHGDYLEKV